MRSILGVTLVAIFAMGCRGDAQKCEQACRNFGHLVEGKAAEAEIAAAASDQRDALRKDKAGTLDRHVENCVSKCISGNDPEVVACLIAARTREQALACGR